MSIGLFLAACEVGRDTSWTLALPFPCVCRATAEEFKQKKPYHLLRSLVHTITTTWVLFTSRWNTFNKKAIFIVLGKLSQLTDNVAVKITLFRCLNSQEIAIVKLKMISLPIFHYCFSASVCVCGGVPLIFHPEWFSVQPGGTGRCCPSGAHLGVVARCGKLLGDTDVFSHIPGERCLLVDWALQFSFSALEVLYVVYKPLFKNVYFGIFICMCASHGVTSPGKNASLHSPEETLS